jgi:hypothetical protein
MTLAFAGRNSNRSQHAALLQNGMVKLMAEGASDDAHSYFAHPFAWAPFVVTGAGAP